MNCVLKMYLKSFELVDKNDRTVKSDSTIKYRGNICECSIENPFLSLFGGRSRVVAQ